MAKARDRTEDFKDAVRQSARSLGYDEVYIYDASLPSTHDAICCWINVILVGLNCESYLVCCHSFAG
jgi:hypothetical protein